jgi:hypothetical protein
MKHLKLSSAVIAAVLAAGGVASADLTRNVISAFRGQIVITKDEITQQKDDKTTIAKIKEARLKELTGEKHDDVAVWNFHYTAFLSKSGGSSLKLEFITDDKDKRLSADKELEGVDAKASVLNGDITIDEDEGLTKGRSYIVKLTAGNEVLASTPVTMK